MKSRSPLALMEQVIMVLVFALAAAFCLRVFAFSNQVSRRNEAVDQAVSVCQRVAEELKAGVFPVSDLQTGSGITALYYNEAWQVVSSEEAPAAYILTVEREYTGIDGLAHAKVRVSGSGEELFSLRVAWQEVVGHG